LGWAIYLHVLFLNRTLLALSPDRFFTWFSLSADSSWTDYHNASWDATWRQ